MNIVTTMPRFYTALAEWMPCLFCVIFSTRRYSRGKTVLLSLGALLLQSVFLMVTDGLTDWRWILCMVMAVGMMYLYILLCCHVTAIAASYYCMWAFMVAEFAASFGWQLCVYAGIYYEMEISTFAPACVGIMLSVYLLCGVLLYRIIRANREPEHLPIGWSELGRAMLIVISCFTLSNLSYVLPNMPFSAYHEIDLLYVRTLVDAVGVVMLYAWQMQRMESHSRFALTAADTLLKNQYDQYCLSKESVELVNQKYHDLKHQIAALREESGGFQKEQLDRLENSIKSYDIQFQTGNHVLDIVLTGKSLVCQRQNITLTCVVDGSRLSFMDTMDICALFGNALDNAIEGTGKVQELEKRMIHLSVNVQKSFLLITLENYFGGELRFVDGLPQTTSQDQNYHGFGTKSIRTTAQNYGGTASMTAENGWFQLKVIIPVPDMADCTKE